MKRNAPGHDFLQPEFSLDGHLPPTPDMLTDKPAHGLLLLSVCQCHGRLDRKVLQSLTSSARSDVATEGRGSGSNRARPIFPANARRMFFGCPAQKNTGAVLGDYGTGMIVPSD